MSKPKKPTAEEVKRIRARLGMSQRELASLLGVGRSTVAKWESAENVPPGDVILLLQKREQTLA